jgi:hypothetical protein
MNDRSNPGLTPEQFAACGAAVRAAWAREALSLPHAMLIVDEADPDGPYHLFGPYDTRCVAFAVAVDYLETFDENDDLDVRVIPLRPMDPPSTTHRSCTGCHVEPDE